MFAQNPHLNNSKSEALPPFLTQAEKSGDKRDRIETGLGYLFWLINKLRYPFTYGYASTPTTGLRVLLKTSYFKLTGKISRQYKSFDDSIVRNRCRRGTIG